jgi:CubicO group peptidase (beta-lactamase class C family)
MLGMTLTLLTALGGCAPQGQHGVEVTAPSLQQPNFNQAALDQILSEHPLFAGSVLVAWQGRVIASGDVGQADRSAGRANGPMTRYSIGSIGKLVTAISVAMLVRDGSLQWTTPVVDIIPELAGRLPRTVTVDHLLRHRSGLDGLPDLDDAVLGQVRDNHDRLSLIVESGIDSSGPSDFAYRNENYQILGEMVARVSGRSYEDYVTASLLAPLRIRGPVFMSAEAQNESPDVARPYLPVDFATWWASETSITPASADAYAYVAPASASSAAGGALMSGQDLLALLVALAEGAYGDGVSTEVLCEPTLLAIDVRRRYARGCETTRSGDLLMMGHTGSTAGVQARAFIVPTERVVVVVLSNHDDQAAPVFDAIIARLGDGAPS